MQFSRFVKAFLKITVVQNKEKERPDSGSSRPPGLNRQPRMGDFSPLGIITVRVRID